MEIKKFSDYEIAEVSVSDEREISTLEKAISNKSSKDIVLIAYQTR